MKMTLLLDWMWREEIEIKNASTVLPAAVFSVFAFWFGGVRFVSVRSSVLYYLLAQTRCLNIHMQTSHTHMSLLLNLD